MSSPQETTRTLRLRLKDKHSAFLHEQAREVNFVWNYCNEVSFKILKREERFCSNVDLDRYTAGAAKEGLSLHSQTVQAISKEFVTRRKQFKKAKLRWRVSGGARRSLGWIPFKASAIRYRGGQVWYGGHPLSLWDSYGLSQFELGTGTFSEDSRGRWYLNVTVKRPAFVGPPRPKQVRSVGLDCERICHGARLTIEAKRRVKAVGLDLGLKDFMSTSDGEKVEAQRFYQPSAAVLHP